MHVPNGLEISSTQCVEGFARTLAITGVAGRRDGFMWTAHRRLGHVGAHRRRIVGWATSERIDTALVSEALHNALREREPGPGLMHHSDRGSQYASNEYREMLELLDITCSMSRKGNCWDNACMERFFSSLKSEWIGNTIYTSHEDARADIFKYIETFYNTQRRHATLGYKTPAQNENEIQQDDKLAA